MGLAQKRIVKEYSETQFPAWKKKFDQIVGAEIPMEVKWDTMQSDDYQDKNDYEKWYSQVYFQPLEIVFRDLCSDDMGREAVKSAVKKIVIDGSDGISPKYSTFENGTLTILHKFSTNVDDVNDRAKKWTDLIGSKL